MLNVNNNTLENISESELCKLKTFGNMSANVLHHARKPLFSLIMTQILNSRRTECPILLYLAKKYLKRNEFCLVLTLKKLSVLLFPLTGLLFLAVLWYHP